MSRNIHKHHSEVCMTRGERRWISCDEEYKAAKKAYNKANRRDKQSYIEESLNEYND